MVRLTNFLFALSTGLVAFKQVQADVTIFQPVPTDPALQADTGNQGKIIGVSPIALASGGATQYVATEVATAFAAAGTTETISPETFVFTFEEGGSTYHASAAETTSALGHNVAVSDDVSCGPGSDNNLNCTEVGQISIQGSDATAVTTQFVASQSAIFTITGSIPPLSTAKSGASHAVPLAASMSLIIGSVSALEYIL